MKIKHSIKKQKIIMKNKFITSQLLSEKFYELFNRPYCFHKNEVLFCEEREIDRFDNVKVIVNSDDHQPLHFHIKTINPEGEYRVYLDEYFNISNIEIKYGKHLPKRIERTVKRWFNEQDGKKEVITELKRIGII